MADRTPAAKGPSVSLSESLGSDRTRDTEDRRPSDPANVQNKLRNQCSAKKGLLCVLGKTREDAEPGD